MALEPLVLVLVVVTKYLLPLPAKKPKRLANYSARQSLSQSANGSSFQRQLNRHLEMDDDDDEGLPFWQRNRSSLNKLVDPPVRPFCVPAASSAVERVLSQGGVVLTSHRTCMSDNLFSRLVYLKCKKLLLP